MTTLKRCNNGCKRGTGVGDLVDPDLFQGRPKFWRREFPRAVPVKRTRQSTVTEPNVPNVPILPAGLHIRYIVENSTYSNLSTLTVIVHCALRKTVGTSCTSSPARPCTTPGRRRLHFLGTRLRFTLARHSISPPNGICCTTTRFPSTSAFVTISHRRHHERTACTYLVHLE